MASDSGKRPCFAAGWRSALLVVLAALLVLAGCETPRVSQPAIHPAPQPHADIIVAGWPYDLLDSGFVAVGFARERWSGAVAY